MAQLIDCRTTRTEAPVLCWRNAVADATASATDTATDYDPAAVVTYASYEGWQPNDADAGLTLAFAADQDVDYIAVLCEGADNDTAVAVEYSTDGASYTEVRADGVPIYWPARFGLMLWLFDEVADVSHIRVSVIDGDVTAFRVVNVMSGKRTELQRNIYVGHTPAAYGRQTQLVTNRAESGAFLGRIVRRRSQQTAVQLRNVTPEWFRDELDEFYEAAETQPFVFAWRPSTDSPNVGSNPGFDGGTAWTQENGGVSALNTPRAGANHFQSTATGGNDSSALNAARYDVKQGDVVSLFGWLRTTASPTFTNAGWYIQWRDDGDSLVSEDYARVTAQQTTYTLLKVTATCPAGATKVASRFDATGISAGTFYADDSGLYVPRELREQRLTEVSWGWMSGDGQMVNQRPNGMVECGFQMVGLAQ